MTGCRNRAQRCGDSRFANLLPGSRWDLPLFLLSLILHRSSASSSGQAATPSLDRPPKASLPRGFPTSVSVVPLLLPAQFLWWHICAGTHHRHPPQSPGPNHHQQRTNPPRRPRSAGHSEREPTIAMTRRPPLSSARYTGQLRFRRQLRDQIRYSERRGSSSNDDNDDVCVSSISL